MGEYADNERGESIKIGTCEDMYYLRFDQRNKVTRQHGSVNPVTDAPELRFRFPWPDEDQVVPGDFDPYERALAVHGFEPSGDFEHHAVQFVAQAGYNVCLPCPESALPEPFALVRNGEPRQAGKVLIHRNGFPGSVQLVQQRFRPGIGLVPVLRCGGCGAKYRLEERHEIELLAVACRLEGETRDHEERLSRSFHSGEAERKGEPPIIWAPMPSVFWHTVADRILAGIVQGVTP